MVRIKSCIRRLCLSLLLAFICMVILVCLIGIGLYGAFVKYPGPIWKRNNFIGIWLSVVLLFFSLQTFYLLKKQPYKRKSFVVVNVFYFCLVILFTLILTVFYGLQMRMDSIVFGILIFLVNSLSLVVLITKQKIKSNNKYILATSETSVSSANPIKFNHTSGSYVKCFKIFFKVINGIFKFAFLVVIGFLAAGAVVLSIGTIKFPPRGKFIDVPLIDSTGRTIKIHYLCDGPMNVSMPTFMIEGGNTHSYATYLNLQKLLKSHNRRSCVWDKAGQGYSDFLYSDMTNHSLYYQNFVKMIDEKNLAWIGWGDGGSLVYDYLSRFYVQNSSNSNVSLTLIDAYPTGIEWKLPFVIKNWSNKQMINYITSDMEARFKQILLINAISVPFGLINFFVPSSNSSRVDEYANERRWSYFSEKTWATQRWTLTSLINEEDVFSEKKLNQNIPINHIMSVKSDEQIIESVCFQKKFSKISDECDYEIRANRYLINVRKELTTLTENGQVIECEKDECNQEYFMLDGIEFTVKALLELYPDK